ncbi:EF-P 5-aminopentanol modification-associated protein YfmH [Caldalkalibacillus salinus]|uniref:EF-P 5-aminopentanol modification-associated protein YfmH n=1 Tax=Caldalkalibacillus salinus TaxID=2803787 RepID=UPI001922FB32|nr:pitrilysin family protein [Caldalkalibacillus salinus]
MSLQSIPFEQLDEVLFHEKLANGLDVFILPKNGFNKTYATFTTKYGSMDNHFAPPGQEATKVPDGIAHFLEHKMFEEEEGDVFNDFSKHGANANAFTSFDRTAYLFSSTKNVKENLTTLINFVQNPYFTDENVEKEKGIIEQEIRMYQDNPDWRVFFGLIEAFYHNNPVKIDIAGTVESIYEINKDMLYTCYNTFYHPSNMLLFVIGPVDPEDIMSLVRENQAAKDYQEQPEIQRLFDEEPNQVSIPRHEIDLSIGQSKCMMGYKELALGLQGPELLEQELATSLLMDLLFGQSTDFYQSILEEGLIDDSFGTDYNLEKEYGFSVIGSNTKDPDAFISRIKAHVQETKEKGIDANHFERNKKKKIGSFLRQLNSPEFIANQFTRFEFNNMNLFDVIPTLESITLDQVQQRLQDHFKDEQFATCIVR